MGNHEFDLTVAGLVPFLNDVKFPVLAANINTTEDHILWKTRSLKKSVVFEVNGVKVGVIGYITPETKYVTVECDVNFSTERSSIK